jgi:hypothetical protein
MIGERGHRSKVGTRGRLVSIFCRQGAGTWSYTPRTLGFCLPSSLHILPWPHTFLGAQPLHTCPHSLHSLCASASGQPSVRQDEGHLQLAEQADASGIGNWVGGSKGRPLTVKLLNSKRSISSSSANTEQQVSTVSMWNFITSSQGPSDGVGALLGAHRYHTVKENKNYRSKSVFLSLLSRVPSPPPVFPSPISSTTFL